MAEFFTAEDCRDLVKQLRTARKPRPMTVQNFYWSMQTLNQYAEWLPGTEPALTANQLKDAFKEAMSTKWQDEFSIAGRNQQDMTMAEVLRCFRQREKKANEAVADNQHKQHQANGNGNGNGQDKKNNRFNHQKGKPLHGSNTNNKQPQGSNNNNSGGPNATQGKRGRVEDTDHCPVHPFGDHTWGDCRANAYNKKAKTSGAPFKRNNSGTTNTNMIETNTIKQNVIKTKAPESNSSSKVVAINDMDIDLEDALLTEGMFECHTYMTETVLH